MTEKWELIWMVYDDEEGKERLLEEEIYNLRQQVFEHLDLQALKPMR